MELISKKDLLQAMEKKYEDLTDERGCSVDTNHGFEWLSLSNIAELVHDCETYDGADEELEEAEKEIEKLKRELEQTKKEYEQRLDRMHTALLKLTADTKPIEGVRVTKTDFLAIYQKALDAMWENQEKGIDTNDIYGYDFTVHWHGLYCNCSDGAVPSNNLIPGIEGCNDEDPDEY